jgi:predicted enzyme related to lactoylglutathione lyase
VSARDVERVLGIGGVFFRANDPAALAAWYLEHLGIDPVPEDADGHPWVQQAGPTVFAPFPAATDYFGRPEQQWMLNFRVRDLDAMRNQLRAAGATVEDATEVVEGIGRFGWAVDPEGNRFELWEPTA